MTQNVKWLNRQNISNCFHDLYFCAFQAVAQLKDEDEDVLQLRLAALASAADRSRPAAFLALSPVKPTKSTGNSPPKPAKRVPKSKGQCLKFNV